MGIFRQFPYSNFHDMNMDEIIKIVREMLDEWARYYAEWEQWKGDINAAIDSFYNWFQNLNVQTEINNKLTAMKNSGELEALMEPYTAQVTTAWLTEHITQDPSVVIDSSLTVAGAAADAKAAGDAISDNVHAINYLENVGPSITLPEDEIVRGSYWRSDNGRPAAADDWSRSKYLIPFKTGGEPVLLVSNVANTRYTIMAYDENRQVLNSNNAATAVYPNRVEYPKALPAGTYYIGVNVHYATGPISFRVYDVNGTAERPYSDTSKYHTIANYWANASGVLQAVDTYNVCMLNVKAGEKWYTNQRLAANFACYNKDGTFISDAPYTDIAFYGRIYTIPADSVYAFVNISHSATHQGVNSIVNFKITKSEKILCIGDSTTWLDDRQMNDDNATRFMGYQKVLERAGYRVASAGFNGCSYGDNGSDPSIHAGIVDAQYDVSGYDVIILFGGLNDDLYQIPVGDVPATYSPSYNIATMLGGLGDIIRYIRQNNTTAKIILCTMLKSQSLARPYDQAVEYANGIKDMAQYASCYLCDIFQNLNIQPFTAAFTANFYDSTHPNKQGMEKVGALMLDAVNTVTGN